MADKNSPNLSSIFAKIIAALLAALFVIAALMALIAFNVERQAFNPATYKRALVNENFYRQFPALMGNMISKNLGNSAPPFAKLISANDWKFLIENLLPPEQLRSMTEDAITQFFAYMNGDIQTPYISFAPLKHSLAGSNGLNAALTIIRAKPNCTLEQLARMVTSLALELCNPPAQALELAAPFIQTQLKAVAAAIPDQAALISTDAALQQSRMQTLKVLRLVMRLSPLLPLALLLAITLLAVRTFRGWLNWWGWPLLLTGLPGAIIGFGGAPLFRTLMELAISQRLPVDMPVAALDIIRKVADSALREMLKPAGWEGLFLFVAGTSMVLVAAYMNQRAKEKLEAAEAPTKIF